MRVCALLGCCPGVTALAMPKSMTFGVGWSVEIGHEQVAGLQVPMDHAFLVSVLNGIANAQEQGEPRVEGELVTIAVGRERNAGHVLHREVQATVRRGAGIDDVRDARVTHQRERLAFLRRSAR